MIGTLLFAAKASLFRLQRLLRDRPPPRSAPVPEDGTYRTLVAEARAPLRDPSATNSHLTIGKIENLRRAVGCVDGVVLPAGGRFSFWRQVGRPTRRRGFVEGREIREGCVVPSVGGGLCQLSNALYSAALDAEFPIVERHAHSRPITRSAVVGRDATVFWNYVDFRFQTPIPLRISATMSADELILQFWTEGEPNAAAKRILPSVDRPLQVRDCTTCGRDDCQKSAPKSEASAGASHLVAPDSADARRDRLARALAIRWGRFRSPDGPLAPIHLAADRRLARALAAKIPLLKCVGGEPREVTHLTVPLRLLVPLAATGALGGRTYDVVLDRAPLAKLHAALDAAAERWPSSETLGDYRASPEEVAAESRLLAKARALLPAAGLPPTPVACTRGGRTVYLPASPLGRFGAFALQEALASLPHEIEVKTAGSASDGRVLRHNRAGWQAAPLSALREVAVLAFPAVVVGARSPAMALLRGALNAGIPAVVSDACPFSAEERTAFGELLTVVPGDDPARLAAAIAAYLPR